MEKQLRRLGLRDAFHRGTLLSANILMTSMLVMMPGFGTRGLLIATFIQLTFNGLFEIPTGIFADRFGWYPAVRSGFTLKLLSTTVFFAAVIASYCNEIWLAWLLIAAEAILDAFASSFVSGAYQAAYQKWFELQTRNSGLAAADCAHPFLQSMRYGWSLRVLLPLGLIVLGSLLHESMNSGSLTFPIVLFSYVLCLRFGVIWLVRRDLHAVLELTPKLRHVFRPGATILLALKHSPQLLFLHAFFTFLVATAIVYLMGQNYELLVPFGLSYSNTWICGAAISLGIHASLIFISRFLYPRLAARGSEVRLIQWFLAALLTAGLIAVPMLVLGNAGCRLGSVILYTFAAIVLGQAGQRWIVSHVGQIPEEFRATWFSVGEVFGLLFFAMIAGLVLLSGFAENAVAILMALATMTTMSFLVIFRRGQFKQVVSAWSLQRYLSVSFLLAILTFSAVGAIWESRSFVSKSLELRHESEKILVAVFEDSLREAVTPGARTEVRNQARRLMDASPRICVDLILASEGVFSCDKWRSEHGGFTQTYGDLPSLRSHRIPDGYKLSFDESDVIDSARTRFFMVLGLFFVMGLVLWITIRAASARIFLELNQLLEWKDEKDQPSLFLISEFEIIAEDLRRTFKSELEAKTLRAVHDTNRQVAHDIRSPLSAFAMVAQNLSGLPEAERILLRSAVERVREIADRLVDSEAWAIRREEASSVHSVRPLIAILINEKRLQFRDKHEIEFHGNLGEEGVEYFALLQPVEFKRVLSNLINNAVEALPDSRGRVGIALSAEMNQIFLRIEDNGIGIASEVLQRLPERGRTHGKPRGHGLGLFHAKTSINKWGGELRIQSAIGAGTTITVVLPEVPNPR